MIAKPFKKECPGDKAGKAGYEAEKQMAFYLRRAFKEVEDVFVYNDLRFVRDEEVAQIDHLVLHRYGFCLVESKSVTGIVEVNKQLEFVRVFGRKRKGMKSPITQVEMQGELLQKLLNDNRESLRRKIMLGLLQAEFGDHRFIKLVAVSDQGEIKRRQCDPPELVKADRVVSVIRDVISRRERTQGLSGLVRRAVADKVTAKQMDEEDVIPFTDDELRSIRRYIRKNHCPQSSALKSPAEKKNRPGARSEQPSKSPRLRDAAEPADDSIPIGKQPTQNCEHCRSHQLRILYGPYGYYFECLDCSRNTKIEVACDDCSAKARVSKRKTVFSKVCKACGSSTHFYTNPSER